MNREITDHIVEGDLPQNQLKIMVMDEPGAGGANHLYRVTWYEPGATIPSGFFISFQNGPIKEVGMNGITQEALLAIVIDRLKSFQDGPFPSKYNDAALHHCEWALTNLKARTKERLARGVEGIETWWENDRLFVGFKCSKCGEVSGVEDITKKIWRKYDPSFPPKK